MNDALRDISERIYQYEQALRDGPASGEIAKLEKIRVSIADYMAWMQR